MSKQLKLKFKKILKKADFTHADLEYHEELLPEAKQLFMETISKIIEELSDEDKARIADANLKRQQAFKEELQKRMNQENSSEEDESEEEEISACRALTPSESEDGSDGVPEEKSKSSELKKIFYRVAELTHPDKLSTSGFSPTECTRLEKVFKRAREAYENHNWYVLYSIAVDLDISVNDPTQENIDWVEEDIRYTLSSISRISSLVAWVWYVGDEAAKQYALHSYFQQTYNLTIEPADASD
tara:strand:- start:2411 stop:3139 length:729 start_codon:yes stop_codon:yes gene_type:complete